MKGSNRMVPFLDLRTDLLTMLVLWVAVTETVSGETRKREGGRGGGREAT